MWRHADLWLLLRPCQGRWPHLLQMEMPDDDRFTVWCANCGVRAPRLTGQQAERVYEQNQARIDAVERDRSVAAGQPQSADAHDDRGHSSERGGLEAEAPASGGAPMTSNEEKGR